jgi:predicted amidohydrolase
VTVVDCRQLAPLVGDLAANRALTTAAIREAVAHGAEIVLLPELATSGYVFADRGEAASVAVTPRHELFAEWAAAANGGIVVGGFCEDGEDGRLYNSAAVVDRGGVRDVYRKLHLWDREKLVFEPGATPPPVLLTPYGRLAVVVCYDLEFPELTRDVALRGAELLLVPTNWPLVPRPDGEHPPEVVIAMATARTNRMFIACCDRDGTERGQEWTAGTCLIDREGWLIDGGKADLDLSLARDKSLGDHNDAFGDRRPELYA